MADRVRIFVSHHHSPEEDAFTARLVTDLKAAGADVWVDDEGITSDDFVRKISEGLIGRQWLVLVMTPASVKSPWVQREVNAALAEQTAGRMLGVLPLVMTPCDINDIPVLWRTLHNFDASSNYTSVRQHLFQVIGLKDSTTQAPELSHPSDMSSVAAQAPHAAFSQIQEFLLPSSGSGLASIKPGPDGALWFIESKSHRIGRIGTDGQITEFPISYTTRHLEPVGITAGPDKAIWFTLSENGYSYQSGGLEGIGRMTPGELPDPDQWFILPSSVPKSDCGPSDIAVGPDGALWFTETLGDRIGRITTTGEIKEFSIPTPKCRPSSITSGPDGALWFTENKGDRIGRIIPQR